MHDKNEVKKKVLHNLGNFFKMNTFFDSIVKGGI